MVHLVVFSACACPNPDHPSGDPQVIAFINHHLSILTVAGWRLSPTPLKNMSQSIGMMMDDELPNMMGKITFMFQTTNQVDIADHDLVSR